MGGSGSRMKILIYGLNTWPEPVGIGRYTGELVAWLAERGHEVRAIAAPPYFPNWRVGLGGEVGAPQYRNRYRREHIGGVRVQRCPLWVPARPNGLTRLLHLSSFALTSLPPLLAQRRWRPDVVFTVAPAFFCAPGALLLRRLCGRRSRAWLHIQDFELDAAFELGMLKGPALRRLAETGERRTLRGFDAVSTISAAMVQKLAEKGVAGERTRLVPNWVDLTAIRPQGPQERFANPYRRELGLSDRQTLLLYSGSMNKKQGVQVLAEVIRRLRHRRDLVWLLAGEGATRPELEAATADLPQVRWMPLQPSERLNDWLNAADIHLLPQKEKVADLVLPSKLMGILASGRPVVASSPPGSELALLAADGGLCVPPEDVAAFTAAVERLADDPALRAAAGLRARRLAERHFGREAVLAGLERELEKLQAC